MMEPKYDNKVKQNPNTGREHGHNENTIYFSTSRHRTGILTLLNKKKT